MDDPTVDSGQVMSGVRCDHVGEVRNRTSQVPESLPQQAATVSQLGITSMQPKQSGRVVELSRKTIGTGIILLGRHGMHPRDKASTPAAKTCLGLVKRRSHWAASSNANSTTPDDG